MADAGWPEVAAQHMRERDKAEAELAAARDREKGLREALEGFDRGAGGLIATTRCFRRPKRKDEPDPGPCGQCVACLAKEAQEKARIALAPEAHDEGKPSA